MKYVDEFRNAEIARAVAAEIASVTDPDRHYKLMEVCGATPILSTGTASRTCSRTR